MHKRSMYKVIIAIAVALAFIMPSSAFITNDTNNLNGYKRLVVQDCLDKKPLVNTFDESDTLVTPFQGDDCLPSITEDLDEHVVITWTNKQSFTETYFGIGYSSNSTDPQTWYDNGVVIQFASMDNSMYWDTALVRDASYNGLFGCFTDVPNGHLGGYVIPDITSDFTGWDIYTWDGDAPGSYGAEVSDEVFYQDKNYENIYGPFSFYIYHLEYDKYDIPRCPVVFHTGFESGSPSIGASYFDGQTEEVTAPSGNIDYVDMGNRYHSVVQNVENDAIIWKKVVPVEDPDYEYTPYQDTVATGTDPAIAAYDNTVAIVYANNGEVNCTYSSDDGENWDTTTVASGGYPEICAVESTFYAIYIDNGNLYRISSEDGGVTWINPTQVNIVDGTVIEESGSVDIHQAGIVWEDERGDDIDIYYAPLVGEAEPIPNLQIDQISGGFGVGAVISNDGDADATNVKWNITLDGIVFLGGKTSDTISTIAAGESQAIKSRFPLGFGPIGIEISAQCDEGISTSASASGKLLLFYIIGVGE